MAVSDDRKYTKAFVHTLLESVKGKTLGEVDTLSVASLTNNFFCKYKIRHLSSTNVLRMIPKTLPLCTIHNYSNRLNRQIGLSQIHIPTNEWNATYRLSSGCTRVHYPGHSLMLQAFAPS